MSTCHCGSGRPVISRIYVPGRPQPITTCGDCAAESARQALHDVQSANDGESFVECALAAMLILLFLVIAVLA